MALPKISPLQLDMQPVNLVGIPPRFMNANEREVIIALLRSVKPKRVVEIGCNVGGTSLAILRNVPTIEAYIGIDVLPGYVTDRPVQRNEVPQDPGSLVKDDPRFRMMLRERGSFDVWAEELFECSNGEPYDAVFVDGDHGREGVLNDRQLARKVVRPGGIIIFHDYHQLGTVDVKVVLDQAHAAGAPLVHVAGTWVAYERTPEA